MRVVEGITNPTLRIDGIWSFYASTGVNVNSTSCLARIAVTLMFDNHVGFLGFYSTNVRYKFFLYRTHRLVKRCWRWRISCIMMTLILAHLGAALYNTEKYFGGNLLETKSAAVPAWMSAITNVMIDVALTATLYICLRNLHSENTGFLMLHFLLIRANAVIKKICFFMANRFLLTTLVAISEITLFNASHTFTWVALDFIFGKVQTNALLAILNARRAIKGQGIDEDSTSTTASRHTASKKTAQIERARTRGTRVSSLRRMGSVSDDSVYDIRGSMALHSSDFATSEAITSSGPGVESVV
ncbi:hypothetical protein HWV62_31133 [Athelia sp. TMB]|nr:hypothetical protein HWV62_31133 [Athelia sp. TMB]